MGKFGLFLELIGFLMLFWKVEVRPSKDIEAGGAATQHPLEESTQIEKTLDWLPDENFRKWLAGHFTRVALISVVIGVLFQLISCQ